MLPQIVAATRPPTIGRYVFVSYSHKDARLAAAFMEALYGLAGNAEDLGLARERIFFDRGQLLAGDKWSDGIESALRVADLVLFLVSTSSLNSAFCVQRELAIAAEAGKTIVPVLLSPTAEWQGRKMLPGRPDTTLGSLQAVPTDDRNGVQPISGGTWTNQPVALAQAMKQIAMSLRRGAAPGMAPGGQVLQPAAGARARNAPRRTLPPLLPHLCNQMQPENSFEKGLDGWPEGRALLVLLKGEYPDDTTGFWNRVREKNLADYCEQSLGRMLRPAQPLVLPRAGDAGPDAEDLQRALRRRLSEALTGKPRALANGLALAALLATLDGVLPLWGTLPQDSAAASGDLLRALLAVLDDVPDGTPMNRLAITLLIEDPGLVAEDQLVKLLSLQAVRTHVIETRRLQPLSGDDVKIWHRAHDLEGIVGMDEETFVQRLFEGAPNLRHRTFDQRVRPILGLTRDEAAQRPEGEP